MLYFGRVWFFWAHGSLVYFVLISTESFSAYIQHLFMIHHFVETPRNFKNLLLKYYFLCGPPPPHLLVSFFPWLKLNFWPLIIFYLLLVVFMYNRYQLIPWKWDFQRFNHIHVYIRFNSSYVHKIMFKRSFFFKLQTLIASQFRQTKLIVQSNVAIRGYSGPIQH